MEKAIHSRWFSLADLGFSFLAGLIWYSWPGLGWWPLLLAILPLAVRLFSGRSPVKRTVFDLPLVIFLLTAAVGVWAAYDRAAAWEKFWIILASVLLFYSLAGQPRENLWVLAGLLSFVGALVAAVFLLGHDWQGQGADLQLIDRIGRWWMAFRPSISVASLHPNTAAGLLSIFLPFSLATGWHYWNRRDLSVSIYALVTGLIISAGLFLSSSRGAWLALVLAGGALLGWEVGRSFYRRLNLANPAYLIVGLLPIAFLAVLVWAQSGHSFLQILNTIPGNPTGSSRVGIYRETISLVQDFLLTGAGLGSFAGLYSHYILVIPLFFFGYAHNLYLDVALEQGVFGFLAFMVVILGSLGLSWVGLGRAQKEQSSGLLLKAALVSLLATILHGFIDDALYGNQATPFLFLLPGLVLGIVQPNYAQALQSFEKRVDIHALLPLGGLKKSFVIAGSGLSILVVGLIAGWHRPIASLWYSNLGAIYVSQAELADFPTGKWDDGSKAGQLTPFEEIFHRALRLNPENRAAHHRLGQIAMLNWDFDTATVHFERAYRLSPSHIGVRKSLGYSYVWAGQLDKARTILAKVPEAEKEMGIYKGWWNKVGREDLSGQARKMSEILAREGASKPFMSSNND